MAHWAELNDNNIVLRVLVGSNDEPDEGYGWLLDNLGGRWVKTSYTSRGGNRVNPDTGEIIAVGEHFRYNYAGEGFTYDEQRDAFIPPQPFPSWVLDEATCQWTAPTPMPSEGFWTWNEDTAQWIEVTTDGGN